MINNKDEVKVTSHMCTAPYPIKGVCILELSYSARFMEHMRELFVLLLAMLSCKAIFSIL